MEVASWWEWHLLQAAKRSQGHRPGSLLAYMLPPRAAVYFHLVAEGLWPWTQLWDRSIPPWISIRLLAWKCGLEVTFGPLFTSCSKQEHGLGRCKSYHKILQFNSNGFSRSLRKWGWGRWEAQPISLPNHKRSNTQVHIEILVFPLPGRENP